MNRRADRRTNTHGNNVHRDRRRHAVSTSDVGATCELCQEKRMDRNRTCILALKRDIWWQKC